MASDVVMLSAPGDVVQLSTPTGPVYLALDDQPVPDADGPVLTRSEVDAVLSLACQIAPDGYLRRTLWTELHRLVALKRALLGIGGVATFSVRSGVPPADTSCPEVPGVAAVLAGDRAAARDQAGGPHGVTTRKARGARRASQEQRATGELGLGLS